MSNAAKRLRDWNDGADDVPPTYTHDALEFQQDLRALLAERDAARAEAARLREALERIDATDLEERIAGWSIDAVRGTGVAMRRIARAALAKEAGDG